MIAWAYPHFISFPETENITDIASQVGLASLLKSVNIIMSDELDNVISYPEARMSSSLISDGSVGGGGHETLELNKLSPSSPSNVGDIDLQGGRRFGAKGILGAVVTCALLVILILVVIFNGGNETQQAPNSSPPTPVDNHALQVLDYTSNSSRTRTEQIHMTTPTIKAASTTRQPVASPSGTNPITTRPPLSTLITEIPKGKVIMTNDDMGCGIVDTITLKYIYVCMYVNT